MTKREMEYHRPRLRHIRVAEEGFRRLTELGARIKDGREDVEDPLVRYTIPVPVRGLRAAGSAVLRGWAVS